MYNWLISGSLLGWYRQCGAIPYTSDADTATWASDFKPWMRDYFLGPDKGMRNYSYWVSVPETTTKQSRIFLIKHKHRILDLYS